MRTKTPRIAALQRTLAMLEAVVADGGTNSVAGIARALGMPVATAHRQVTTLVDEGYLAPVGKGRHIAGPRLRSLLAMADEKRIVAVTAAPILRRLAAKVGAVAQLGTLENDMVTYQLKAGEAAPELFTKVGLQLEAYCSAIGKVLLAHLPDDARDAYLAGGPFVALTARTITDPAALAEELRRVRSQGFATDNGEIAEGLLCMAVPVRKGDGSVPAAISVSQLATQSRRTKAENLLPLLQAAAGEIEGLVFSRCVSARSDHKP